MNSKNPWIIQPKASILNIRFCNIYPYRYLLKKMILRDINSFYRQTLLGPLWFITQPLLTTGIFVLIFGFIIDISPEGIPRPLFYLSGIMIWNFFTECVNKTMGVFKDNVTIFSKVYFPRIIVPISMTIALSARFSVQILLFMLFFWLFQGLGYEMHFSIWMVLTPVVLLVTASFGMGLGILIAASTIRYRDLSFFAAFGIQLMMYTTPVIYPLSAVPSQFKTLLQINPMTVNIEVFRYLLFQKELIDISCIGWALMTTIFILSAGIIAFKKAETNFIDTI